MIYDIFFNKSNRENQTIISGGIMKHPVFTEESVSEMAVPRFKEHKTTQIAALLVKYSGGEVDLYKLIKLIYLIDRESLKRRGHPVTFDRPYNLPLGPTPGHTYHLIWNPWDGAYWSRSFSLPNKNIIRLLNNDTGEGELSQFEMNLISEVYEEFGNQSFKELKKYVHSLPEFDDLGHSSKPMDWNRLLKAVGWNGDDLVAIRKEFNAIATFENMMDNTIE